MTTTATTATSTASTTAISTELDYRPSYRAAAIAGALVLMLYVITLGPSTASFITGSRMIGLASG